MTVWREHFLQYVGQTSPAPMMVDVSHAQGIYIYDTDGQEYVDLSAGICVSALGHAHPAVLEAIHQQADRYLHTTVYGEHVQEPQIRLARRLVSLLGGRMETVYFTNSGSEATEGALKLARRATGRTEIIAARRGYHGSTIASMSLMSEPDYSLAYMPGIPGVRFITFSDFGQLAKISERTAAVILEPIQGPAGIRLPHPDYLSALRKRCDETGSLLILDEIQCGIGRTGSFCVYQSYDIEPDIVLLAKALGGGMPIGAIVSTKSLLDQFSYHPMLGYISTFGGHPLCCAAGDAALSVLQQQPELIAQAPIKAERIRSHLRSDQIQAIRHAGLMIGVDLEHPDQVRRLVEQARAEGILLDHFLFHPYGFRIAPPLIIEDQDIDTHIPRLNALIETICNS